MTYADSMAALCTANNPLMAVATGGVYVYPDSGRKGINRLQLPLAFDPKLGLLKPTVIFYELDETADNQAVDALGYQTTQTPVSVWVYDHGDAGYGTVADIAERIIKLLNFQAIPNAFQVIYTGVLKNKREPNLKDAACWGLKFNVHGFRSTM